MCCSWNLEISPNYQTNCRKLLNVNVRNDWSSDSTLTFSFEKHTIVNMSDLSSFTINTLLTQMNQDICWETIWELNHRGNIWTGCKEHGDFPSALHMVIREFQRITAAAFYALNYPQLFSCTTCSINNWNKENNASCHPKHTLVILQLGVTSQLPVKGTVRVVCSEVVWSTYL